MYIIIINYITIVECKAKNMQEYVGTQTFSVTVEPPHSFTKELLPSREDIGTEWKFPTNKQVYNELRDRGSVPENYSGFAEFTWYGYMKVKACEILPDALVYPQRILRCPKLLT